MSQEDISRIENALFFEPPETRNRVIRFVALILFSSVIATGGLMSDSVAAIIGAMIIAPLMTPIMAIVVASIVGRPQTAWRSSIVLTAGIGMAVLVGFIMGHLTPTGWNILTSSEIISRTDPGLLDLVIALASGGAGAYALSRQDVTDSLPGVAISISLVPPLNAAGLLLAAGENQLARGALLLFITNMAAIFLAGSLTFMVTGLARGVGRQKRDMKASIITALVFAIVVAVPLASNTTDYWNDINNSSDVASAVDAWIGDDPAWELYSVNVESNHVTIELGGEGTLPDSTEVLHEIVDIVGPDAVIEARIAGVRHVVLRGDEIDSSSETD